MMKILSIIKNKIVLFINRRIRYDIAEKILYFFPKHRKPIKKALLEYNNSLKMINAKEKQNDIVIVFVCQVPSLWNGLSSIYQATKNNSKVKSYVVAIPEKIMGENYDVKMEEYGENYAYNFCKEFCKETINGYNSETKEFFDLKCLEPTYVFLQRPYDIHLPEKYRSGYVNRYAKVCYVPYGYDSTIWDSRYSYEMQFICNIYAIFVENEFYKKILNNIFKTYKCLEYKRVFNLGYPRFDLYKNVTFDIEEKFLKTVLWMPRWTTDSEVEATTFFKYKDIIIDFFKEHRELQLICRPHPLMLRNFVSCNLLTESEAEEFLNLFRTIPNFRYDIEGDYIPSFRKSDIYISDYSSLLVEELIMDKPIIYTGEFTNFESNSKKWSQGIYKVNSEAELIERLTELISGKDVLKGKRKKIREKILNNDFMSGEKIVSALILDYGIEDKA